MSMTEGFEKIRTVQIRELRTEAHFYRHQKTGAELLSLVNDDENKVFGITFRTPPRDSSGVAHILEHSVLCGSRKYPVKEPFVQLLKGSLKTFLNAFTYPDKTCYPVASQNTKDFYNLIDVYLDAVFYPRISPHIFQQEGWHIELPDVNAPLSFKGVVYNEMKGAYSSPDNVLSEYSQQSLFPDTTYGLDSGGDPKKIIELSFDQFKSFHQKYYHPSNARIFFYGNDDPHRRLAIINDYLKDFERLPVASGIPLQPPFETPRRIIRPYCVNPGPNEELSSSRKGMITVNWALAETRDPILNFGLQILEFILLGMPGSPLRKALIDSGLGDDIAGVGLERELRQMYFSCGLKGIRLEDADRVETLILETLDRLASGGIDPLTVEAAVNTIEFRLRENNSGSFPRGLNLMLRSLTTWLYDGDPLCLLAFEAPLESIKQQLERGEPVFEGLIERFFLKNQHRATLILRPDPDLAEREAAEEKRRLKELRDSMTPPQLVDLVENTKELARLQELPDSPEALATIPVLKLSDLDPKNKIIPQDVSVQCGIPVLFHDIFTNGIFYLDIGFDLHSLDQEYVPLAPLFGRALIEMGTDREDFVSLTQRISRKTGGIRTEVFTSTIRNTADGTAWLFLRSKSTLPQVPDLIDILHDILLTVHLDNRERFHQMVLEEKARQEQKIVPAGHQMVNLRIRSQFNEADWAAEQMGGLSYLEFLRNLVKMMEEDWPSVFSRLEKMRENLINRNRMVVNTTMDQQGWSQSMPCLNDLLAELPQSVSEKPCWTPNQPPLHEGMIIPAQVNYVGKGANLYELGYSFDGSIHVIGGYLRTSWLWEKIRVQGGAYGAFCMFDRMSGVFTFVSYRDPNIERTLNIFDETAAFLRTMDLDEQELTRAIIGAIGTLDSHLLPDAQGFVALLRHLSGDSEEERQRIRDKILTTTPADFKNFAEFLNRLKEEGIVKVLGSQSAISNFDATRPGWLKVWDVL